MIRLAAEPTGRAAGVEPAESVVQADAVERLYERHSRRIFGFCLYQLRKPDEAEEAVQTTFLYALGALRRGVVPAAESAWLLKIARNVCLSRFDAARRRRSVEQARDPQVLAEIAPAAVPDDQELLRLDEALAGLPERQRRAIVLREWQGLSYAEIAEELGLSQAAVETLLFRARRALARELRGEEETSKRHGLDLGSVLGWAKSLLAGGAAKVAVGAAVVATVGAVATEPLLRPAQDAGTPRPPATAPGTDVGAPARSDPAAPGGNHRPTASAKPITGTLTGASGTVPSSGAPDGSTPAGGAPAAQPPSGDMPAGGGPGASPPGGPSGSAGSNQPGPPAASREVTGTIPAPSIPLPDTSLPALPGVPSLPPVSTPSLPALPPVSTPTVTTPSTDSTPPLPPVPTVTVTAPDVPSLPPAPAVTTPVTGGVKLP